MKITIAAQLLKRHLIMKLHREIDNISDILIDDELIELDHIKNLVQTVIDNIFHDLEYVFKDRR
jgi:hypothetical protein